MKPEYIDIRGEKFRIEFNWNATVDFLEKEDLELSDVDSLANLKPSQITTLIYMATAEGQRLDKKPFPLTVRDFGSLLNLPDIKKAFEIYKRQTAFDNPAVAQKKTFFQRLKK